MSRTTRFKQLKRGGFSNILLEGCLPLSRLSPRKIADRAKGGVRVIEWKWPSEVERPHIVVKRIEFKEGSGLERITRILAPEGIRRTCMKEEDCHLVFAKTGRTVSIRALQTLNKEIKEFFENIVGIAETRSSKYTVAKFTSSARAIDSSLGFNTLDIRERREVLGEISEMLAKIHANNISLGVVPTSGIALEEGVKLCDIFAFRKARNPGGLVEEYVESMKRFCAVSAAGEEDAYEAACIYAAHNKNLLTQKYKGAEEEVVEKVCSAILH